MNDQALTTTPNANGVASSGETRSNETPSRPVFRPQVDVVETAEAVVLLADMPGVDETSIDLTVEKDSLTLRGTVAPSIPEGFQLGYAEYRIGDYQRTFALSNDIDRSGIEASIRNGVLRVTLPKSRQAMTHKVTVQAG